MKGLRITQNTKWAYLAGIALLAFIVLILLLVMWEDGIREHTVLSDTYEIDKIYKSMKGPNSRQKVYLSKSERPELLWLTGYKAVMVGSDGKTPMSQEFMCHSNLDLDIIAHRDLFGWRKNNPSVRLFTLSQGQAEIKFPEGFGIPILSTEPLDLSTQVLNLNNTKNKFEVRHKITFTYIPDRELNRPMKPIMTIYAQGLKLLEGKDGYFNVGHASEDEHGPGCLVGENADTKVYSDFFGRTFTAHWVVKPGREVNHTLATKLLNVPYDTTVHYIAVHLHPFAESLELKDLTTEETVYKSKVTGAKAGIGIENVDYFPSEKGIPLYKDHEYQIISVYNNTSDEDQDSMALMLLYVLDKEFRNPFLSPCGEEACDTSEECKTEFDCDTGLSCIDGECIPHDVENDCADIEEFCTEGCSHGSGEVDQECFEVCRNTPCSNIFR